MPVLYEHDVEKLPIYSQCPTLGDFKRHRSSFESSVAASIYNNYVNYCSAQRKRKRGAREVTHEEAYSHIRTALLARLSSADSAFPLPPPAPRTDLASVTAPSPPPQPPASSILRGTAARAAAELHTSVSPAAPPLPRPPAPCKGCDAWRAMYGHLRRQTNADEVVETAQRLSAKEEECASLQHNVDELQRTVVMLEQRMYETAQHNSWLLGKNRQLTSLVRESNPNLREAQQREYQSNVAGDTLLAELASQIFQNLNHCETHSA